MLLNTIDIKSYAGCPETQRQANEKKEKIELREDLKSRRGLAVNLEIICHNCGESTSRMSSKISNKCYDINLRLTYGMRAIRKDGAAARIFCGLMNLPPPPAKFERHNALFLNVLKTISEDSMNAAVHEAVIANDNNSNIAVAVDGTWHKIGYSSLNGVVCATSVENGKVIDFEALTRYCSSSAVAEWYRYRIVACLVTSSSPVPLKTRHVGQRCMLNLLRVETFSRWCGVVVRREGCQLRCHPRHLTMVQNYVVRRQKPSCS
ncbi:uncharacterized protein TNCV_2000311 [Trichonephila clavipes]|nr:uncharacterized protein TNCV_2000311 [Trichonephila clavipes]